MSVVTKSHFDELSRVANHSFAEIEQDFQTLKDDVAVLKYGVTYNRWENIQKQLVSPNLKKKPMSQSHRR